MRDTSTDPRRIIALLRDVARPLIMSVCRVRSNCVASSKIVIDTLQSYGIDAQPLVTRVCVRNREHLYQLDAWARRNGTKPAPEFLQRHWRDDLGAWAIYIGHGGAPPGDGTRGFDGHLVVHVPSLQFIIDASIDQVDRIERKIGPMPPVMVWRWDVARFNTTTCDDVDGNGTRVEYERVDKPTDEYESAPDWRADTASLVTSLRLAIASRGAAES